MLRSKATRLMLAALCVGVLIVLFMDHSNRLRRQVDHWAHGWRWTVPEASLRQMYERRREGIAAVPAEATELLIEDLHATPGFWESLQQFIARFRPNYHWFPRAEAAFALGCMGPKAKAAIPELIRIATNGADRVQMAAVVSLGEIGSPDSAVMRALQALTNPPGPVAVEAAIALWRLDSTNSSYIGFANSQIGGSNSARYVLLFGMPERVIALGTNAFWLVPAL